MLRSMLVHTNLSEEDGRVLEFARGLPALGVRRIVLSSVVDASGLEGPVIVAKVERVRERLLELAAPLRAAGLDIEVRVPTGTVESEILALAAETQVDGIVSGTHGKSHVDRFIAGSISEQLLTETSSPALFVRFSLLREAEDPSQLAASFGRSILVPTDFSAPASRAFVTALDLPPESVTRIFLLHVADAAVQGDRSRQDEGPAFHLRMLAEMAEKRGFAVEGLVRRGPRPETVLETMREVGATGVVCGSRGRNALANALFGSLSLSLLQQAQCPVLAVP